jgi:hypothetical protein
MGKAVEKITDGWCTFRREGTRLVRVRDHFFRRKYGHSDTLAPATGRRPGES